MQPRTYLGVLLALCLVFAGLPAWAAENCQPQPKEDDFVLPGPNGQCFAFRVVAVGEGESPFTQKVFTMGDPDEEFRGSATRVTLGGSFFSSANSKKGLWFYYLGKFEVTEGQYYSVMGLPQGKDAALLKSNYPITGISYLDAMTFQDKLNTWLFANAIALLPVRGKVPGYVRLPTEAEWEFAARGGMAVREDLFTLQYPYENSELAAHEWFAGPSSSHNKVQPVGGLKPNPLGLHDMLGNVSEMTYNLYQMEFYQGRAGGMTARGGHFLTNEDEVRSVLRTEQPLFLGDVARGMKPNTKPTMGFRLALGAPILTDSAAIKELSEGWEEYRAGAGTTTPASLSVAPVADQTDVQANDAKGYLQRVQNNLRPHALPEIVHADLRNIEAAINETLFLRKQADEDVAVTVVRLATYISFVTAREYHKRKILEGLIETAVKDNNKIVLSRLEPRMAEIDENINEGIASYHVTMEQLSRLQEEVRTKGVDTNRAECRAKNIPGQLWTLENLVIKHCTAFRPGDSRAATVWREDFKAVPGELFRSAQ